MCAKLERHRVSETTLNPTDGEPMPSAVSTHLDPSGLATTPCPLRPGGAGVQHAETLRRATAARSRSRGVTLDIRCAGDHRVHRAVGLRQDHGAAVPQPDARPHPGRRGAAARSTYHGEDLYGPKVDPAEVRRRIGMVFQKPNPFPKSIYDNVAYGPRINGEAQGSSTTSSSTRSPAPRCGTR